MPSADPSKWGAEELVKFLSAPPVRVPKETGIPEADAYTWRLYANELENRINIGIGVIKRLHPEAAEKPRKKEPKK